MPDCTIRNKSKNPIYTLNARVLESMLAARPEASSLVMAKHAKAYKALTGKPINITYEQELMFLKRYGADERGTWKSAFSSLPPTLFFVERAFADGFLQGSVGFKGFVEELEVAEAFFDMLERHVTAGATTA